MIDSLVLYAAEEDKEEKEDAPAPEGKWYHLYYSGPGELLLHVVIYSVAALFLYQFLQSRGYWQRFVQPVLDVVWYWVGPGAKRVWSVLAPVGDPVVAAVSSAFNWLAAALHSPVDPNSLKRPAKA